MDPGASSLSTDPIFVVGMQRSGTTLMRALLSAHPKIAIAPETHFLNQFVPAGSSKNGGFEGFWNLFSGSERFRDLQIDAERARQSIIRSGDHSERGVFTTVLRLYAESKGKDRWGEKTPHHYRHIHTLLEWYPDARIVYLLRDPRGVCTSLLTVPWRTWSARGLRSLEHPALRRLRRVLHDARCWQSQVDELVTRWLADGRIILVRYEDLVSNPKAVMQTVCDFVGELFSECMITGRRWSDVSGRPLAEPRRRTSWEAEHLARSVRPISSDAIDKWRTRLTAMEIGAIEDACSRGMEWAGYRPIVDGSGIRHEGKLAVARMWSAAVDRVSSFKTSE